MKTVTVDDYQAAEIARLCGSEFSRLRELYGFWEGYPRQRKNVCHRMREIGKIRHLFRIRRR